MDFLDYDKLAAAIVRSGLNPRELVLASGKNTKLLDGVVGIRDDSGAQKENARGRVVAGANEVGFVPVGAEQRVARGDGGEVGAEAEASSWSDIVAEAADGVVSSGASDASSVSGGGIGVVSDVVKRTVTFGGVAQQGTAVKVGGGGTGFFAQFVRSGQAVGLYQQLKRLGVRFPKEARAELAYCAYTAGTMPSVAVDGKLHLRGLASVGDAAITLHLCNAMYHAGREVESMQAVRSKYTNDKHLAGVMQRLGLLSCVSFPPGVDPLTSKPGATALEAIVGVMSIHLAPGEVASFLVKQKVFDIYN